MLLIPWFATAFSVMFGSYKKFFLTLLTLSAGPFLIRVLASFGAGWAVYELGDYSLSAIHAQLRGSVSGLPQMMIVSLTLLRVDECIQIIFGAYTAKLVLNGWTGGIQKVFRWK